MRSCSIAKLNNESVALFQNGHHDEAILGLKTAVKQIISLVRDRSVDHPVSTTRSPRSTMPIDGKQSFSETLHRLHVEHTCMPLHAEILHSVPMERPKTIRENQTATALYSFAVFLPETCQDSSPEHFIIRASLSMLYNLAFMNHWRATYLGISSGIGKALQLYSMALKMIPPEENCSDIDHLAMAIWNNMGHLYSQLLFQLHEARMCFDRLRYLLVHRTWLRSLLPSQDYEIFMLSAMFQGSDLLLAPAA